MSSCGDSVVLRIQGQKFGRLLALEEVGSINNKVHWRFLCDCGTETVLAATFVKRGHTQSCGCLREERSREAVVRDISGERFGRLLALNRAGSANGRIQWLCRCDCGTEVLRPSKNLTNGTAVSCGCRKNEPGKGDPLTSQFIRDRAGAYSHQRRATLRGVGGSFTAEQIADLLKKQRGKCPWCGCSIKKKYEKDHRKAVSRGGDNSIRNISLLCKPCNNRKSARDEIVWANMNGKLC